MTWIKLIEEYEPCNDQEKKDKEVILRHYINMYYLKI